MELNLSRVTYFQLLLREFVVLSGLIFRQKAGLQIPKFSRKSGWKEVRRCSPVFHRETPRGGAGK